MNQLTAAGLDATGIRDDKALPVDEEELNSLVRDAFVADRIFVENVLDLLPFVLKTNHVDLFVLAFDLNSDVLDLFHALVDSVVQSFQLLPLDEGLHHSFPFSLVVHHEVDPPCALHVVDVFDHGVYFVELDVEGGLLVDKLNADQDQLDPAVEFAGLCHDGLGDVVDVLRLNKDSHEQVGLTVIDLK